MISCNYFSSGQEAMQVSLSNTSYASYWEIFQLVKFWFLYHLTCSQIQLFAAMIHDSSCLPSLPNSISCTKSVNMASTRNKWISVVMSSWPLYLRDGRKICGLILSYMATVRWTYFCHTMVNGRLIQCAKLCAHRRRGHTFTWWSDWRTRSALGLIERHAVSPWMHD